MRNRAAAEGCMAESYNGKEVLNFVSRYFNSMEITSHPRVDDVPINVSTSSTHSSLFPPIGKPVGGSQIYYLSPTEKFQAHRHVLNSCSHIEEYRE